MESVLSSSGQTLDDIVYQVYGFNPQMIGPVTDANPHVLEIGIHLPAKTVINLPPQSEAPKTAQIINLWN